MPTWQTRHLRISYEPLLREPWILDIDSTVKPLYGHQEGAVKGYNPASLVDRRTCITPILRPTFDWC